VQVVDFDPVRGHWYAPVDLNDRFVLAHDGLGPNEGDPRSHQHIVYAVAMSVIERFERYLDHRFRWRGQDKLRLVPHAIKDATRSSTRNVAPCSLVTTHLSWCFSGGRSRIRTCAAFATDLHSIPSVCENFS
jgi:hypothetical protein